MWKNSSCPQVHKKIEIIISYFSLAFSAIIKLENFNKYWRFLIVYN